MSFAEAAAFVRAQGQCAFAAVPVFGDDGETAEGARVFILARDGSGGFRVRFLAGPFFSAALAADEVYPGDEVPERVRELQFLPSVWQEEWCSEQIQDLIARLVRASSVSVPHLPDYLAAPARSASPDVSFPVSWIGGRTPRADDR